MHGPGQDLNDGVRPTSSDTTITVADYGRWVVRVQACNTAGCGGPVTKTFEVEPAPEPTATPAPTPEPTPTPSPTLEPASEPTATATPAPEATPTPDPLRVSVSPSATVVPGEQITLSANISNAPAGSSTCRWEMDYGGGWITLATTPTASYQSSSSESVSFRVALSYGPGESATPDPVTVTFRAPAATPTPEPTPPRPTPQATPEPTATPTGLEASATAGSLDVPVDWDDVASADDYLVRWRLHGPGQDLNDGERHTSASANITVAGYGDWVVQAQACNNGGCSSPTALHFKVVPAAPTGLTATPESGRVSLTWTGPSDSAITKYQYRVSDDGGTSWGQDWTDVSGSGASTTSHTVTGLTNATTYTFELRVVAGTTNGAGAGATATPGRQPRRT